ncbi:hypothetical protein F4554_001207 [Actinopolymorpha rutila]|uniref:Uncharacterized protein n=1 Tax=Actinopolymorpha rutila TaxID=446787 RepID=A0A852ZG06_9ACTN|nr:hypothetical protein [Actinopolymorpha rutila]
MVKPSGPAAFTAGVHTRCRKLPTRSGPPSGAVNTSASRSRPATKAPNPVTPPDADWLAAFTRQLVDERLRVPAVTSSARGYRNYRHYQARILLRSRRQTRRRRTRLNQQATTASCG